MHGFAYLNDFSGFSGFSGASASGFVEDAIPSTYSSIAGMLPDEVRIGKVSALQFVDGSTYSVDFTYELPSDFVASQDLVVVMAYHMSTSFSGNIRVQLSYDQVGLSQDTNPGSPTATITQTVTPNSTALFHDEFTFTIAGGTIPNNTYSLRFSFSRLGGDGADTHTGNLMIEGISIRYTGFGSPTSMSGTSGTSGFSGIGLSGFSGVGATGYVEEPISQTYSSAAGAAPAEFRVGKLSTLEFPDATTTSVDFLFDLPIDFDINQSMHVVIDYHMSTSFSGNVRLQLVYDQVNVGDSTNPGAPTGTITQTLTPSSTLEIHEEATFTIAGGTIPSTQYSLRFSFSRLGSDGADTHTGKFRVENINIRYAGFGAPVSMSGISGFSGPGFSGPSGPSGFSGFSGTNGIIGLNGDSGFSGFSGARATAYVESRIDSTYSSTTGSMPLDIRVGKVSAMEFVDGSTYSTDFTWDIPDDMDISQNVLVVFSYHMSTSFSGNVRLQLIYDSVDLNGSTNPGSPTGTLTITETPSTSAFIHQESFFTIPGGTVSAITSSLRFTLSRLGADGLDTHTGNFRIENINIRYVGFGAPVQMSGISGFSGSGPGLVESTIENTFSSTTGSLPNSVRIGRMSALEFPDSSTYSVDFNWDVPEDLVRTSPMLLIGSYHMSTSTSGNFVVKLDYEVVSYGGPTSPGTTGSVQATVTPSSTASIREEFYLTIPPEIFTTNTQSIRFTLSRLGADASDTHTGILRLENINIRYTGFGAAVAMSGFSGTGGTGYVEERIDSTYSSAAGLQPSVIRVGRVSALNLPDGSTYATDFLWDAPDDCVRSQAIIVVASYHMSTSFAGNVYLSLDYEVVDIGQSTNPGVATTLTQTITPSVTANIRGEFYFTLPPNVLTTNTQSLRFTLSRLGGHAFDTHTGELRIENINIRYAGFGASTQMSGVSGFSGTGTGFVERHIESTFSSTSGTMPSIIRVGKLSVLDFADSITSAVDFMMDIPVDFDRTQNTEIILSYHMSTAAVGSVVMRLSYDLVSLNGSTNPGAATGTLDITVTPSTSGNIHQETSFVIAANTISSTTQSLRFTLMRLGSDAGDTHTGNIRVESIDIKYVGFGAAVAQSGLSGFSGVSDVYPIAFTCGVNDTIGNPVRISGINTVTTADASAAERATVIGFIISKPTTTTCIVSSNYYYSGPSGFSGFSGTNGTGLSGWGGPVYLTSTSGYSGSPSNSNKIVGESISPREAILRADTVSAMSSQLSGNRNKIINGAMDIWQRGTSLSIVGGSGIQADRWVAISAGGSGLTITNSQDTDVPTVAQAGCLFSYSNKIAVTTAEATITGTELMGWKYTVEGYDWKSLAQQTCTFSFWFKSNKSGTYSVAFNNVGPSAPDRAIVKNFLYVNGDGWKKIVMVLPPSPSGGTWNYTNGYGLQIYISLAAGSTYQQATIDTWNTVAQYNCASTSISNTAGDTIGNNFWLTGVQFEPGVIATPFEYRPFEEELSLCQRYCWRPTYGTAYFASISADKVTTNSILLDMPTAVQMRSAPTLSVLSSPSWVTAFPASNDQICAYDYNAVGYLTITGALSFSLNSSGPHNQVLQLIAGTSFSAGGGVGAAIQVQIGGGVNICWLADLL